MSDSIDHEIDLALEKHQAGQLDEARLLYTAILSEHPESADALHLLGVLHHQQRDHAEAVRLIERAIELDPDPSEFYSNLAEAYKAFGKTEEAIVAYGQAVERDPLNLAAWQNLGLLLQIHRRPIEAVNAWQKAVQLDPDSAVSHNNFGMSLQTLGRLTEAKDQYRLALSIKPNLVQAIENLTIVCIMQGDKEQAVQTARTLIDHLEGGKAPAYVFFAAALNDVGQYHDAIDACRDALKADGQCVNAHYNMGRAMAGLGEPRAAAIAYARAAEMDPQSAYAQIKLGLAALSTGHIELSSECFARSTELAPAMPEGWHNLAVSFDRLGDTDRAMAMARRAVAVRPSMIEGITMIGMLHLRKGEFTEAETELRRAMDIRPTHAPAIAALANVYVERGDHATAQELAQRAADADPNDFRAFDVLLMTLISDHRPTPVEIFQQHQRYGNKFAVANPPVLRRERLNPAKRLRIGYVSPDFRAHSVSFFSSGLFRLHNHHEFEIVFYDDSLKPDNVTLSIKNCGDQWHRVVGISHERLAEQIASDEIDILVDLAGHTADNRLPMFALKPAPIQISYLGYPSTSGVPAIDYRITDELADPVGFSDQVHTEKLIRVPAPFLCYQPSLEEMHTKSLPALSNGFITFCSFNVASKLNDAVIDLWARVLMAVDRSRLIIKASALNDPETCRRIEKRFAAMGVQPDRLQLMQKTKSYSEHMECYNQADVALDTFPYNGTTTTCEALWMGLPVIALAGKTHSARVGVSLLSSIGLNDWITEDFDAYIERAKLAAGNFDLLSLLRSGMRDRMQRSPLMDSKRITASIEKAYREVWQKYCREAIETHRSA